jgi:autotransporter-associated beta strand protein
MILSDSSSAYAGSNQVRTIASFNSSIYHFTTYSDTILSKIISGNGIGTLKNGPGVLTLSATNTYTGNTTISAGVLSIINTNALPGFNTNGRFAVAPNATLAVYNAVTDAEVLTLRNTTNFRANSNIGFDTTSGNRTYTPTIGNTSQGALGVTKLGQNTLIIPTAGTYTGTTSVVFGTLSTFGANRIPDSSPVFIDSGATLVLGGSDTLATISGRGTLNCQNNNITLNSNNNSTFSGTLTSTANSGNCIYKQGTNTITLSGATIRVAGSIRMDTGGMTLAGNSSFIQNRTTGGPRDFQISLPAGTTFNLTLSGGASLTTSGCMFGENNGGSATVNLLSGATWNSGGGNGQSWMAGLSSIFNINGGAYSAGLFFIGGGVVAQNPTSIINLNSGSFNLTNTLTWQGAGRCVFNLNGGTATFSNFGQAALTDNTFNFNGGTFTIQNNNNYSYNYSNIKYIIKSGGAIFNVPSGRTITLTTSRLSSDGGIGGIVKNGTGTLSLGNNQNTFAGQVLVNEGTISVSNINNNSTNGPFGNNALPIALGSTGKSATLTYTGGSITTDKSFIIPEQGIGIFDTASSDVIINGIISGEGTLVKTNNTAALGLSANNTYSGGTRLDSGLIVPILDNCFGVGNLSLNGGSIRSTSTRDAILSNTVDISANTTFPNVASEKSLTFNGPTTLFGSTRTLTVNTGTTVAGNYINFAGPIGDNGNGYGITMTGTGNLILSGNNTYSGNTTINSGNLRMLYLPVGDIRFGGGTLQFASGITTDLSSKIKNNTNAIRLDTNGQTVVFESLSSSNTGGLLKIGTGTLILTGSNNTYMSNNGTTVSNVGTLTYAGTHRTPAIIQISNAASVTTGVITISGSLTQTSSPAGTRTFAIAEAPNAIGTLNIVSGATVELSGGMMMGGNNTNPVGILNMFGGSLNTKGALWSCGNSVVNIYNGTIFGGSIYHGGGSSSPNTNMTSTINISGGSAIIDQFNLGFGQLSGANTITNLVSGTLSVNDVNTNSRPNNRHTFYFNGGTLNIRATSTFPTLSAVVRSGGAIIDVTGTITTSSIFSDGGGGGGFTKLGSGLFGFNAINTYTGTTNVSAGTLRVLKKISGTGSDASFSQANFTPTTLSVTFVSGTPPSVGNTYKLFSGSTQQTYNSVTLVNYSGTASYDSATSTLTINS